MGRSRRQEEDHGGGMERWLLTYADLITLLMAFFIIMYAMSTVDATKYSAMAQSLKLALGLEERSPGLISTMMAGQKPGNDKTLYLKDKNKDKATAQAVQMQQKMDLRNPAEEKEFAVMISKIKSYAKMKGIVANIDVKEDGRGIVINLSDKVLYESGKADLSPTAKAMLDDIAGILFTSSKHIKVEGHTDNIPINNERYPSNWQLSTDRSTSVIMYWLSKYPADAGRLSAAGYGPYRPVASNATPYGRAKNRRVEIIVLRDLISKGEPAMFNATNKASDLGEKLPKAAK
ncbi:MAG: flagellar motor protein MotB [Candidatus Aquicultor sp.]